MATRDAPHIWTLQCTQAAGADHTRQLAAGGEAGTVVTAAAQLSEALSVLDAAR